MVMKNMKMRGKRGQVTLFIIVALIVVAVGLIFFLWIKPNFIDSSSGGLKGFDGCVEDAVSSSVEKLGNRAGFISPEFSYKYNNYDVGYLCYTNLYYRPCIVQKPFLVNHFEEQLLRDVREEINICYENSIDDLKSRGYDIVSGGIDVDVSLEPKKIMVHINAPTSVLSEGSLSYQKFDVSLNNPVYDMLMVSTSILQYETRFGDSDIDTFMVYYPDFIIDKLKQGDGTTVYVLQDKNTKTKFQFASRSYAWPPGYGISSGLVREQ